VATEQAQVSQIEAEIANDGTALQQLVSRSNQAQDRLATLQRDLSSQQEQLRADRASEAAAAAKLRAVALYEYVNGSRPLEDTFAANGSLEANADSAMIETEYVSAAGVDVNDAIHALSADERRVYETQTRTKALADAASHAVTTLAADRQAAQQALDAEQSTLSQVKGNLAQLLAQAQAQQSQAQQTEEASLASQARAAQAVAAQISPAQASPAQASPAQASPAQAGRSPTATPPASPIATTVPPEVPVATPPPVVTATVAPTTAPAGTAPATTTPVTTPTLNLDQAPAPVAPSPGAYDNPLRSVKALYPERVDQGVDYSGYGPIYAIGDGVVLSVTNSGWPDKTFIAYRLTDGPAAGLTVYAAEDILPSVTLGEQVTSSTVLGTIFEGPDGIETGWASYAGTGATMAWGAGQFDGSNSTAFGYNFSQLLSSLGAPPGVLQNDPATGNLPPGWPQW